jgi:hypothetical protein
MPIYMIGELFENYREDEYAGYKQREINYNKVRGRRAEISFL